MSDPTPAEALKACPLCGEKPERNGRHGRGGVVCRRTGHLFQVYGSDQRDAEERWNTRPPAADAGEVQAPSRTRKPPQWADDSDPIGELAIKLSARASAIEEEEGRGEWTWREIAQCAVDALFPSPPQPLGDR